MHSENLIWYHCSKSKTFIIYCNIPLTELHYYKMCARFYFYFAFILSLSIFAFMQFLEGYETAYSTKEFFLNEKEIAMPMLLCCTIFDFFMTCKMLPHFSKVSVTFCNTCFWNLSLLSFIILFYSFVSSLIIFLKILSFLMF